MSDVTTNTLSGLALTIRDKVSVEEIEACLATLEEDGRAYPRVKYLLALANGAEMDEASATCKADGTGVAVATTNNWFAEFFKGGLDALITVRSTGGGGGGGKGKPSPLTEEVMESVKARLTAEGRIEKDHVATILLEDHGIEYKTPAGAFTAVVNKLREMDGLTLNAVSLYELGPYVPRKRKSKKEVQAELELAEAEEPTVDEDLDLDLDDDDDWD